MNPTSKQKNQARDWVSLWQRRWLLEHWDIGVLFDDGTKPGSDDCAASCTAATQYLNAKITIWRPFWDADMTDSDRSSVCCHELAHVHTWELASLAARSARGLVVTQSELDHADETATEHIAKAMFRSWA